MTVWFKDFVEKYPPGDDNSRYLCSTGGKYVDSCKNGGGYPGMNGVFYDDGLYEAAKAVGDTSGTCTSKYHAVTIIGNNGEQAIWSWGSYLDLSKIIV